MLQLRMNFILKCVAIDGLPTAACPSRIARLYDEVRYDPVAQSVVVVALLRQFVKVPACSGCMIPVELDLDLTHGCVQGHVAAATAAASRPLMMVMSHSRQRHCAKAEATGWCKPT